MFIEDEELRSLFKTASEEHLQKLEAGVLQLEQQPDDLAPLEALLREAHSLKGDARMLGVKAIETLSHQVEHFLGAIARRELTVTPDLSDRLYASFDAMHQFVTEAVTGEPSGIDTFRALADLMGASAPPESTTAEPPTAIPAADKTPSEAPPPESDPPATVEAPPPKPEMTAAPAPQAAGNSQGLSAPNSAPELPANRNFPAAAAGERGSFPPTATAESAIQLVPARDRRAVTTAHPLTPPTARLATTDEPYRIETIRVATQHLDRLMTQAGELTVTKIRIAHVAAAVEQLAALWDEWQAGGERNSLNARLAAAVEHLQGAASENSARLEAIANNLEAGIRTLRLLPLSNIFQLFPRLVRDLARSEAKLVALSIEGGDTNADKRILEEIKDPLMHLIRNAIDHGIEAPDERERQGKPRQGRVKIACRQTTSTIVIEVSDDGRGLNLEKIKQTALHRNLYRAEELAAMSASQLRNLIFLPGFSTQTAVTAVSGRGVGLDVVRNNIERLKGTIQVESEPGQGSCFRVQLGTTLATANVLLIGLRGTTYAIPVEFVQTSLLVKPAEIFTLEGCQTIALDGQAISIAPLATLLELPNENLVDSQSAPRGRPCILLQVGEARFGLLVDDLIDTQDVVLKPQSRLLKRVRNVAGATILGTGEVCIILNPLDLLASLRRRAQPQPRLMRPLAAAIATSETAQKTAILLVEDSIAIRTKEKRILEEAGYEVVAAVDGLDGLHKLQARTFDAIVSDVQMPNLDGLELTRRIRQHPEYDELPIVLVTSLASDTDKQRGVEAGANAYITKDNFNRELLLSTLQRLV